MFFRIPSEQSSVEDGNKTRATGFEGHGNKHWVVVVCGCYGTLSYCLSKEVAMVLLHLAMLIIPLPFYFSKLFTLFMSFQVAAIMLNGNAFWIWCPVAVKSFQVAAIMLNGDAFWIWCPVAVKLLVFEFEIRTS